MARYKAIENGVVVALTPEEETELDTIEAAEAAGADDRAAAEVREKRNKLLGLGHFESNRQQRIADI